jgi:acetyl-CoA synthetase
VLNVSGHRLGTAEVESALVAHPAVAEAAVVGFPHDLKGQGIYAYVIIAADYVASAGSELESALRDQVRQAIGGFAAPDVVHISPGLPKTRSGKIMRRILRKIASSEYEGLGDITTLAEPEVVEKLIVQHRERNAPAR